MSSQGEPKPTRVVALGASAGGLAALRAFMSSVDPSTGFAFVVVSHRSGPSLLGELLQSHTEMEVVELDPDAGPVSLLPNRVVVTPGGRLARVQDGKLVVEPKADSHFPIDYLFRSMADELGGRAIAIVLSGSGTDGTRGIEAVKGRDGLVLVQSEEDAEHDGMPRAALSTSMEDFCLPAAALGEKVSDLARVGHVLDVATADSSLFERLMEVLLEVSGIDFSVYKDSTVRRRIARRMAVNVITDFEAYVEHVQTHTTEANELARDILIGVTSFFRDREAWEVLVTEALLPMLRATDGSLTFRAWVAGCSTGEEAYTLAIVLQECMRELDRKFDVQIFATDVNQEAVDFARRGEYPRAIADEIGLELMERYFHLDEDNAIVQRELREMIIFAPHDVLGDPPFTQLHLVSCRNVLIYFASEVQNDVLALFHHGLAPGGVLFIGGSESLGPNGGLFEPISSTFKIFRRSPVATSRPVDLTVTRPVAQSRRRVPWFGDRTSTLSAAERVLLEAFTPACVIVDAHGLVVYVHGRTGKYLEPAPGPQSSVNVFDMARDGLQFDLTDVHRLAMEDPTVEVCRMRVPVRANGDWVAVDVRAQSISRAAVRTSAACS